MRFPNKVMRTICGTPLIGLLLKRLSGALRVDRIVLVTSEHARNDSLACYVSELGFDVYRGSENDVLDRYYQAAKRYCADVVVRVTGDCPLIDPAIVDEVIADLISSGVDYVSNVAPPTYPNGLDTEVFSVEALEIAWTQAKEGRDREHVTTFIRESEQFTHRNVAIVTDESRERWTVDEPEDFEVVKRVFEHFLPRYDFGWLEVLALRTEHPQWFEPNRHLVRNEGARLSSGQKLWKRATRILPRQAERVAAQFAVRLPDAWPIYFSKARGCRIWDLDGHEFIDMSATAIGANILGYGHAEVEAAVKGVTSAGNMSTFRCPEEVYLAERLVEIHPWSQMVQLARSQCEANDIAISIARSASNRHQAAICNFGERHDWCATAVESAQQKLTANISPRLHDDDATSGVLQGGTHIFGCDVDELRSLLEKRDIGVIKMEVSGGVGPPKGFLETVRTLATENQIVLIFDERATGFRQTFGGLHMLYGVEPDLAIFGDVMGNGYAISAVIGKREVMQKAQGANFGYASSLGRVGPTAALKTLEVMERDKSWERITETGANIGVRWQMLANKYELPVQLYGLPALIAFRFSLPDMAKYESLIFQEMLKKGWLATTSVAVCIAHTPKTIDEYFDALDPVFALVKECEVGRSIEELLGEREFHA